MTWVYFVYLPIETFAPKCELWGRAYKSPGFSLRFRRSPFQSRRLVASRLLMDLMIGIPVALLVFNSPMIANELAQLIGPKIREMVFEYTHSNSFRTGSLLALFTGFAIK